jgi:hypothetical protein
MPNETDLKRLISDAVFEAPILALCGDENGESSASPAVLFSSGREVPHTPSFDFGLLIRLIGLALRRRKCHGDQSSH